MKVDVFDLQGQPKEKIDLPKVFSEPVREDLIRRAVLVTLSKQRQPYAVDPMAGKRTSAHYHGVRRGRYSMMNREMARMPRMHGKLSPHLMWRSRFVPQTTGGREAHPPITEKIWGLKINKKERQKTVRSAIAATSSKELVAKRGHRIDSIKELPIVVVNEIQELKKTRDVIEFLKKIGLEKELERISEKKIKAGRGKLRARKYKKKTGPLFVVTEDKGISKAVKRIQGVNVCKVQNLSAIYLAPGANAGRLTVWSKSAIENLKK